MAAAAEGWEGGEGEGEARKRRWGLVAASRRVRGKKEGIISLEKV
jgi:hypothetical protein